MSRQVGPGVMLTLLGMLLLQSWVACIPAVPLSATVPSVPASSNPQPSGGNLVDHGDGTASLTVWENPLGIGMVRDTWIGSAAPDSNHANSNGLHVGHSSNNSDRDCAMLALDLDMASLWTNVSILSASLKLMPSQMNGTPELFTHMIYKHNWNPDQATWNDYDSGQSWEVSGAQGNDDSGGLMDQQSALTNGSWQTFDVTRSVDLAHYRRSQGFDSTAGVLLCGPAWGDSNVEFLSSEVAMSSARPRFNITFSWGGASTPSPNTRWVDIHPRSPVRIDADSPLTFSATARTGQGDVSSGTVVWRATTGSIDAGGMFTPDVANVTKIEADVLGFLGGVFLHVVPGMPVSLSLTPETATLAIDAVLNLSEELLDAHDNVASGMTLSWHADVGSVNETGVYTPSAVGEDTVTVYWGTLSASSDITVTPGTPVHLLFDSDLTVPSGGTLPLVPVVSDILGNVMPLASAGAITWESEQGSVDFAGIYTGSVTGTWRINATSDSGASGQALVEVTAGELADIELVPPNGSVPADQPVPLQLLWIDVQGNHVPVRIPLSNWTAEDGNFRMTSTGVEWLPRRVGNWTIGVHVEDHWENISIDVVHGNASRLLIVSDGDTVSADDILDLLLQAEDVRGNRWTVSGNWSMMEPEAAPWLSEVENGARFDASMVGAWTVSAEHAGAEGTVTAFLFVEVFAGALARIELQGHGERISADESFDFQQRFFDMDGNLLTGVQLNWTFTHNDNSYDRTNDLRSSGGVWYPQLAGHHDVLVEAGGVFYQIGIDVDPGMPHTIRSLQSDGYVITSGESVELVINATDLDGNDFGTDVQWMLPRDSIELENGSRSGHYLARGLVAGEHTLAFTTGFANGELRIIVKPGSPHDIEIELSRDNAQTGDVLDVEVRVLDYGGNLLEVDPEQVEVTTSTGKIAHDTGTHWRLLLDNPGVQQRIRANYSGVEREVFLDVDADPLYAFGASGLATTLWGAVAGAILLFLLLIGLMRSRARKETASLDMLYEEDVDPKEAAPVATLAALHTRQFRRPAHSKPVRDATQSGPPMAAPAAAAFQPHPQQGWNPYQYAAWTQAQQPQPAQFPGAAPVAPQRIEPPTEDEPQQTPVNETSGMGPDSSAAVPGVEVATEAAASTEDDAWTEERIRQWCSTQGWDEAQISAYLGQLHESTAGSVTPDQEEVIPVSETIADTVDIPVETVPERTADVRESGFMKAMDGTEQGSTGWYLDAEGRPSYWTVDAAGNWEREK
jgi:hypothetical protein